MAKEIIIQNGTSTRKLILRDTSNLSSEILKFVAYDPTTLANWDLRKTELENLWQRSPSKDDADQQANVIIAAQMKAIFLHSELRIWEKRLNADSEIWMTIKNTYSFNTSTGAELFTLLIGNELQLLTV